MSTADVASRIEDLYPLTPLQQGLLFHSLVAPDGGLYVSQIAATLRGPLDREAFARAWQAVIDRHPSQRSTFAWRDLDEPHQLVWSRVSLPFAHLDWSARDATEQERAWQELLAADRRLGFQLESPPLLRLTLVHLGPARHRLLYTSHHLLADGWSLGLLVREVFLRYQALRSGVPVSFPECRPYRDYIAWRKGQDTAAARAFFASYLRGVTAPTALGPPPADVPVAASRFGEERRTLAAELAAAVTRHARQLGVTPSVLAHAAWALFLQGLSGEDDVVFGSTVSGRPVDLPGATEMVGLFINTLPVRVRLPAARSAVAWLRELHEELGALRQYEHCALTEIQAATEVPHGTPLFESLLVFENYPLDEQLTRHFDGIAVEDVHEEEHTHYALTFVVIPGERWSLRLLFDRERFSARAVRGWLERLELLLEQLARAPAPRLGDLRLLRPEEEEALRRRWAPESPAVDEESLPALVESQALVRPGTLALSGESESFTYAELEAAARRVAAALRRRGGALEDRVAVLLPRSPRWIVALLGILKAGATYVPLDAADPEQRLEFLLADSGARFVITDSALQNRVPRGNAIPLDLAGLLEEPAQARERIDPRLAAYVIYTSGSTGTPKGVVVEHRAAAGTAREVIAKLAVAPQDRTLQCTSPHFDVSILEVFATLGAGATLVVLPREELLPGRPLVESLYRHRITVLINTPSLVSTLPPEELPLLHTLLVGGETCAVELPARWAARSRFFHGYGPTEAAILDTLWECRGEPTRPPLGAPLAGVEIYLLDAEQRPVPPGFPGELHLGGRCLARGYHGRAGLTAECFVPHPFRAGARLYRTGDRARFREDGELEFLGRADHQVKVRGHRIELGEIEHALLEHAAVAEAVVVVEERSPGDRRVVACVTLRGAATPEELRRHAEALLPAFLVPASFLVLAELPRTPSGKVDRRKLPPRSDAAAEVPVSRLRTPLEELVAAVWCGVLGVPRVGPDSDFFALGGHSLLATQMAARLESALDVAVPLRALFARPRLADFAAELQALRTAPGRALPPLVARTHPTPAPASFAQQRLWFLQKYDPGSTAYHLVSAVRLRGPLDVEALRRALEDVVARHAALRTTFPEVDGRPVQQVAPPARATLAVELVPGAAGGALERIAASAADLPFDLEHGPLWRARLLRLAEQEHVLLLCLHHIVADGASMEILFRDLTAAFEARRGGEEPALPPVPITTSDHAAWELEWRRGPLLQDLLGYWREQLADAPPPLDLPTDFPRPVTPSGAGALRVRRIPAALAGQVRALGRRENATLFMTLMAAFQTLLLRLTGQRDLVVGIPVAGRDRPELEGLVGFLVNTLPVRSRIRKDLSFLDLLQQVRATALDAYDHQSVPFDLLVEELRPPREAGHTPFFQVMAAWQSPPALPERIAGLEPSWVELGSTTAKYDLTLFLAEEDGALVVSLEYRTDLFEDATAARWLEHFATLLESAVQDPERPVEELAILTPRAREEVLSTFNDTRREYSGARDVATRFEDCAARHATAVALATEDASLTYAELDARASRLAGWLERTGVRPGDRVGLDLERGVDQVVAVLGILKAGAAYVPLDPEDPPARRDLLLAQGELGAVVTVEARSATLGARVPRVVAVDRDAAGIAACPPVAPHHGRHPEALAYVLFTSGSTGTPKAVAVPHRAILRLVLEGGAIEYGPRESFLGFAPLAFDASTLELFGPLLHGGRLVLAPPRKPSLEELARFLARHRITTLWLTAGLFHQLAEHDPRAFRGVRQLLAGGDVLSAAAVQAVLAAVPGIRVINGYGPTECTTFTTCHALDAAAAPQRSVPIGRPLPNTRVYVLDAALAPVPVGVPGRLCVAGDGLAWGYANAPAATAERFFPDPFAGTPGGRLYDTGDRARWRPDGTLEFLGRSDQQVKVRGHRIELEEVEAVLLQQEGVRAAVALARRDRSGDKTLLAFVVPAGPALLPEAVRAHCRALLPASLVPSVVYLTPEIPLTRNGKVDRAALLARAETGTPPAGAPPAGAATPTEEILRGLFEELLERRPVGRDEDFFALGGHSLLATQLVSRVRRALGVELPLPRVFASPTVALLARELEQERRQALPDLEHAAPGPAPLSFAQERLWFLDQLEPGRAFYNIPWAAWVSGELDTEALARAFRTIVRRHEALRTRFVTPPRQEVVAADGSVLRVVDLTTDPPAEREARARQEVAAEVCRPFDLTAGLLLRCTLWHISPERHLLAVVLHHIGADGWSMGVLVRELGALYRAFRDGAPDPLPPPGWQYRDFAVSQRRWLEGPGLAAQLAYWRERLAGAPTGLGLPLDFPRPARQSLRGATLPVHLEASWTEGLRDLCRREHATLFMVLLAGFQAVLARLAGQDTVLVGSPVAGRDRAELEPLLGFFVNTLVFRGDLAGAPSFRELLRRTRADALGAYAHQSVPFEEVVRALHPERDLSHTPLFQVMLVLQSAPAAALELPGLTLELEDVHTGTSRMDLVLFLAEAGPALEGFVEYSTDLFLPATVERLVGHLRTFLSAAAADPDALVSALPLLSPAERHSLVVEWNDVEGALGAPLVPAEIAAQARRTPEAVALGFQDLELSYRELLERAGRQAALLRARGVAPEERVALCLERSAELGVAVLAVLLAGGCCVLLDPAYPDERLHFMLRDSRSCLLLTHRRWAARLATEVPVLALEDQDTGGPGVLPAPCPELHPEHLAYIVYTSGSTGIPKGVAMTHRGLATMAAAQRQRQDAGPVRTLQFSPASFDVFFQELCAAWTAGGALVFLEEAARRDGDRLEATLRARRIQRAFLPPTALRLLAENRTPGRVPSLAQVFTQGEQLHVTPALGRLFSAWPGCRLENHYGPSETHLTTALALTAEPSRWPRLPGIGRPTAGTRVYLLDSRLELVPPGVPGEVFVGGSGQARGYLDRAAETAARFLPDPYSDAPGARMFRTGDLARLLPDGELEFLGRKDSQVKIRGHRVELGEVEAALGRHPAVQSAVVTCPEDADGVRRLVAYFLAASPPRADELQRFLLESLPRYMVPSHFVALERFPLTPSGKVDRRALPPPGAGPADPGDSPEPPRTELEERLARIFAAVLHRERVGIHADFFDLGGHSLLATQLVARVQQETGCAVPVARLFEAPTVAQLAARLESGPASAGPPALRPRSDPRTDAPLSPAQRRIWFLSQLTGDSAVYHLPLALRCRGALDLRALQFALAEIQRRHEVLRTVFPVVQGIPCQRVLARASLPLAVEDLRDAAPAAVQAAVAQEAARPFDLEHGPLARATWYRTRGDEGVLLLNLHHIVADGWSLSLLVEELSAHCATFLDGRPPLPELPVQYADYAAWQAKAAVPQDLEFWRTELEGALVPLDLPADRPRPATQTFRGAAVDFQIPEELTAALRSLGRRHDCTLFMTLLAAFQALVARCTHQPRFALGTPVAGRSHPDTEHLVGCFVNTVVLVADLRGDPTFTELLERVRARTLAALAHQDTPFESVVEALAPSRDLGRSPLYEVVFALHNTPRPELSLAGLSVEPYEVAHQTAKFDLTVSLQEEGGGVSGSFEYNADLFDAGTVQGLVRCYQRLLEEAVQHPGVRVAAIPLADAPPARPAQRPAAPCRCVHWQFLEAAARRPGHVAVADASGELTYADLEALSGALAAELRARGVRPEVRVGVLADRSPELLVGLLAVLRAGGAYVPLDPRDPGERLAFCLRDSGVRTILAVPELRARIEEVPGEVIPLARAPAAAVPVPERDVQLHGGNLAYVIYTSGSTGTPKGVEVTHAGLAQLVEWHRHEYSLAPADRTTLLAAVGFDASVWETWPALATGASLWIPDEETRTDPARLRAWLASRGITLAFLPTPLAEAVLAGPWPDGTALRCLLTGGDRLHRAPPAALPFSVVNHYGPTEDTVVTTRAWLAADGDPRPPPIGTALPGKDALVLDAALRPVPRGVAGELCIAGPGLARGYAGRPDATAERFVPHPFPAVPGARLYRTGDLVRARSDGKLEFLGRLDQQVKVRGVRVELGEIEQRLLEHPGVQDTALALCSVQGEPLLAAYVVAAGGAALTAEDVQEHLRARLPAAMVPAAVTFLERLPVNAHGKLERSALPPPTERVRRRELVPPRTDLERRIAALWESVLPVAQVGIHDNFFDAGGHSLLLARVQQGLQEMLGRKVPLLDLFRHPTVSALARHLAGEAPEPEVETGRARGAARRASLRARSRRQLREEDA